MPVPVRQYTVRAMTGPPGAQGVPGKDGLNALPNFRVAEGSVPALGIGLSITVLIAWDTPFPDTNYVVLYNFYSPNGTVLKLTDHYVSSKTITGCAITLTTLIALTAGKAKVEAMGVRISISA